MHTKVTRWGNSLGVRIPKALAEEVQVGDGSAVEILARDGDLVVRPTRSPRYTLDELLAGVTRRNVHDEVDTGPPAGRESW